MKEVEVVKDCFDYIVAVISLLSVIVLGYFQINILNKQSKISEDQVKIADQQNKITLYKLRMELLKKLKNFMEETTAAEASFKILENNNGSFNEIKHSIPKPLNPNSFYDVKDFKGAYIVWSRILKDIVCFLSDIDIEFVNNQKILDANTKVCNIAIDQLNKMFTHQKIISSDIVFFTDELTKLIGLVLEEIKLSKIIKY